ncbi:MAG: ketopantoate reductase family protein [Lachnospiraceae bacterium]|jgi:2-dehydropantoate 2-reductase|nr:ketopantoate reductase family protein [Lachnospiraceae bacterium]
MRVQIIGMGALGLLFGSTIYDNGGDVAFIMDQERIERAINNPPIVQGKTYEFTYLVPHEAPVADLLIFAVKYNALQEAIDTVKASVGENTILLSVLNGIVSEDEIGEVYGREKLVYSVAQGMDAVKTGNSLAFKTAGELRIGVREDSQKENLNKLAGFFDEMNVPYTIEADIYYRLWSKFMLNVGTNQVLMVYEKTFKDLVTPGKIHDLAYAAMDEVIAIANKEGVALSRTDADDYFEIIRHMNPDGIPSMRQDRIAKRKSEVDMFAGTIIKLGKKHGIPTPVNEELYKQVAEIEANY